MKLSEAVEAVLKDPEKRFVLYGRAATWYMSEKNNVVIVKKEVKNRLVDFILRTDIVSDHWEEY